MKKNKNIPGLGIHVLKKTNMEKSIISARNLLPISAIQIFTHGPRNTKKVDNDYKKIQVACRGISTYIHSSYPTNPWNGKPAIINHTIDQFKSSKVIGSKGVVLHIPKIPPAEVSSTVKNLTILLKRDHLLENQKVILEMKAVKPHERTSYESPEKINRLIDFLKSDGLTPDDVSICIDTAHIYAGKADIYTYDQGKSYLNALRYPEWIGLIHLNGNVYDAKKRAGDKHAVPFDHEDKIWKNKTYSKSGCRAFIEFANLRNIDYIVEIKDHHTIKDMKSFIKRIS